MLPIVMGARPRDYAKVAPPHSYIHVDDFAGPRQLAEYLHRLSNNDTEYEEYFEWKKTMKVAARPNNGEFWCRLCTLLNLQVISASLSIRIASRALMLLNIRPSHLSVCTCEQW